ncbi:type 4a pilus biogenesis protein PilO [Patescibacteria group bacterium]|nr:type 4a pilus biogenesis protein PilO [Patescibacteria group bacterium]
MNKFIIPIILIVLSIGLFVMYIDPNYKEVKVLKDVNNQYQEALNKSKELRKVRDSLLEQYNSFTEEDLSRIRKLLPDNVDNVRLIMDVDSIASVYGAIIRDVKINSNSESDDVRVNIADIQKYEDVTLSFSMSANYENFVKFVGDLRDSLRLVDITHLDFNPPLNTESDVYKYNFTIKTYRLK